MPLIVLGGGAEDAAAPPPPASIIPLREGLLARPPVGNESIAHWYQFSHGRVVTKKVQKWSCRPYGWCCCRHGIFWHAAVTAREGE